MITRENIIHFYTKYKENLKTEDQIQENLLKAEDQEAWIENLKNKSRMMRRLYIENEVLLNLYIRPFLDGEASLNEELAREFLHQIRMADDEGYEDNLAMLEILELLDGYFQKSDDLDSYIWTLNLLGNFYNRSFSDEDGKKGAMYFDRLRALSSRYFEIEDFDVRKRILFSYYNFPVVLMNFNFDTSRKLLQYIDEALEFYNDEKVRELDEERFDFDELIEELNYDLLGNSVLRFTVREIDPELLSRASRVLEEYYQRELEKNPEPYEMLDEIYCNYKSCLFYQGKITCTELLEDYRKFCEALNYVNTEIAKMMAGDGEGATALFEVKVIGAKSKEEAKILSKSVVCSSLTKAAIYGHDANWGRILCALGYSGVEFDPEKVDLVFESAAGSIQIIKNGIAVDYSEEETTRILSEPAVTAIANMNQGNAEATAWGCDLTYDYVKINADYRS